MLALHHCLQLLSFTYEDRSFAAIALKLWKQLPLATRQSNSVDRFSFIFSFEFLLLVVKSIIIIIIIIIIELY